MKPSSRLVSSVTSGGPKNSGLCGPQLLVGVAVVELVVLSGGVAFTTSFGCVLDAQQLYIVLRVGCAW